MPRHLIRLLLVLGCFLMLGAPAPAEDVPIPAPKVLPSTMEGAWQRLQGADNNNLLYVMAAADKFNLNPSVLAAAMLTELITHQKSWADWAPGHPEVRSEGSVVHVSSATALSEGLLRADLVRPSATEIFNKKSNDINYMLNPQPGVDHWYQSCLEAADVMLRDDGVAIGVVARAVRRAGDTTYQMSFDLDSPFAKPSEAQIQRLLSQARAWPEGSEFEWDRLTPGRGPWTVPTFAWVYGRYRTRQFDAEPSDELMGLAAAVYQWVTATPEVAAALAIPEDAPPLVPYIDPPEDYSF